MNPYKPKKEHRFSFGLWCTANRGRDPFGEETRSRLDPVTNIKELGKRNVYGFNYHDDDLIPFGASLQLRNKIIKQTKQAMKDYNIVCSMATTNLFYHRVFKDGAFTSHDPKVHTAKLREEMQALIAHLRRDVSLVDDPAAKALFETSAEVIAGLVKTCQDYDAASEAAFRR